MAEQAAPPPPASQYVTVHGSRIHYVEAGNQDPPVLLLHGIPTHSYLWRNVIPHIAPIARTVAIDLIGFGKSDKPLDIDYDLPTYARYFEGVIDALELKNPIIVAMDLGLIVGLHYAMQHEANVKGLVMFEGFFQPMDFAFYNLPRRARLNLRMLHVSQIAELLIVKNDKAVTSMLKLGTLRNLSDVELEAYRVPFANPAVRRKVWRQGVGPTQLGPRSHRAGDTVDLINRYAAALPKSRIPKLLLYGAPGVIVRPRAIVVARAQIDQMRIEAIGQGKHFLPEDEPENIGQQIAQFHARVSSGS
ncbi:MAG: haloalkane dehalogenase [Chthoniobacterales bacterium]